MVARLRVGGYQVRGVDRSERCDALDADAYLTGDLRDPGFVAEAIESADLDCIVHLAAQSSVRRSFDEPATTLNDGTLPALNLLNHIRESGEKTRVLLIGSADEYGVVPPDDMPIVESRTVKPGSPYALAKSIQNEFGTMFHALYGVDAVMTRSFNHTGPGQREDFVLANFARQVAEIKRGTREPVIEVGNLDIRRDFLDVRDVCDAYVVLLKKGHAGETYNVCSGNSYRIRDLLDRLCALAQIKVDVRVDEARIRPVDMPDLRGNGTKIYEHTGWRPKLDINQTLKSMLEDWDRKLAAA
jgi:GDP-4-dehydro-6-deoxy-D-mannose reductase